MKKSKIEEYYDHIISIKDYKMHYMYSLDHMKHSEKPYEEFCHPRIIGDLIHSPIKDSSEIVITILVSRIDDVILNTKTNPYGQVPLGVGHIEKRKTDLQASLSIPLSSMMLLNAHLIESKLPYIALHTKKMKYGKASVTSYHFMTDYDIEDYA